MNFNFNQQNQAQQQYQFNQQQYQYNQNPQFNQPNFQSQQDFNRLQHTEALKRSLNNLFQLQNQPEFQQLIQIVQNQQKTASNHLQQTVAKDQISPIDPQKMDEMFKRGQQIQQRNAQIIKKILLAKSKLQRMMYQDMNPHSRYEYETSAAMDKIRSLKSEITQKCDYLKTLKVNKTVQNGERSRSQPKSANFSNVGTALTELKKGAEVLEREVLKKKTEMEFVIKYITEGN